MTVIVVPKQQDLQSHLAQKEKDLQERVAEVTELKELQKTGIELYICSENNSTGIPQRIYTSPDFSQATSVSLDKSFNRHVADRYYVSLNLNFSFPIRTKQGESNIYCRDKDHPEKTVVVWGSFRWENEGFKYSVEHNWNLPRLLDYFAQRGVAQDLIDKARETTENAYRIYPKKIITGNTIEGQLIQDDSNFRTLFFD